MCAACPTNLTLSLDSPNSVYIYLFIYKYKRNIADPKGTWMEFYDMVPEIINVTRRLDINFNLRGIVRKTYKRIL
jgi:hypothetical protein